MSAATLRVSDAQPIMDAVKMMAHSGLPSVPVVDSKERSRGVLMQRDVISHLANGANLELTTIGEVATESNSVTLDDRLEAAVHRLRDGLGMVPVVQDERLVGIVTPIDLRAHRRLRAALGPRLSDLNTEISPSDSMYMGSRGAYVVAGVSALECVRDALKSVEKSTVTRILDLPCGAGRVLRVLRAAFPDANLTACDLDRDGVDFCANVLGAKPVYSRSAPDEVELDGGFDLIWCGSLFTHLDARRWPAFFDLLGQALSPGGLLVLTTHGRHPPHVLRRLANASAEWIRSQIDQISTLKFVNHAERAWEPPAPRQDVVTCVRPL
jgi:SAM-dependent methyltransferase